MANPRELAEQAFALLQNALRDSEARASELDEQLKRKRTPKNQLEESVEVLAHRLETVEAERVRWQQAASHLEEIAEAERVKVAQITDFHYTTWSADGRILGTALGMESSLWKFEKAASGR